MNIKHLPSMIFATGLVWLGAVFSVQAEDTEIFFTENGQAAPNVLFILDTSGSMNEVLGGKTRMQILKDSLIGVLSGDYEALNVGVMDFNGNRGGGIDFPVVDINADAYDIDPDIPKGEYKVSDLIIKGIIKNYTPDTFTPMGDALYRAASYFRGDEILYTDAWGKPHKWNPSKKKYEGGHGYSDHAAAIEGAKWGSTGQQATRGINCSLQCSTEERQVCKGDSGKECSMVCDGGYEKVCLDTEVYDLEGFDGKPVYKSPLTDNPCQKNYMVILSDGEPTTMLMRDRIAELVKPGSYNGDWSYENCEVLNADVYGADVSKYGRCLPDLVKYMSTEDQSATLLGEQAVRTYTVGFALDGNEKLQNFLKLLADERHGRGAFFNAESEGDLARVFQSIIDTVTTGSRGFVSPTVSIDMENRLTTSEYVYMTKFTPQNRPGWPGDIIRYRVDGSGFDEASAVSFAEQLTNSRNIYTYIGNNRDLSDPANRIIESNDKITAKLLDSSDNERESIIRWARGIDSSGKALEHMGSSLHSKPAIVDYGDKRSVLFAATNDGFLHAFDISGAGSELPPREIFAFIPKELLADLKILKSNVSGGKVYGLDGGLAVWKNRMDDEVTIYFGMRRGGRNYYALDVTNPDMPKFKWVIEGGSGDFSELGQSWSTPQIIKVKHDGKAKMALAFAGGYDVNQDDTSKTVRNDDSVGRAVFIVDANDGSLLWSAEPDGNKYRLDLKNSIPSNIRAVDLNSNGLADRLYFGDMGGRIWRIDLDESDVTKSTGYQLADLNDGTVAGNRRFYYAPSIAYSRDRKLMVAIGSGYRAHPLATGVQDRFYVIEDVNADVGRPQSGSVDIVKENNLVNVGNGSGANKDFLGWYMDLGKNEKVLAESLIFNNNVSFTTYTPDFGESDSNTCSLAGASAKAYVVRLRDGSAALDSGGSHVRAINLDIASIPDSPYVVFNEPGNSGNTPTADMYVEKHKIDQVSHVTDRLFWRKDK